MTITIPSGQSFTTGTNIYPHELAMVKLSAGTGSGTYEIQTITTGSGGNITVTVPTGTTGCTGTCGTLYLGTPILGFGPSIPNTPNNFYNTQNCAGTCAAFGMHIKNLGFNCQGTWSVPSVGSGNVEGCIAWQNIYAEEESGADTFLIENYNFVGFDSHGPNSQNFGPILNAEIYTGGRRRLLRLGSVLQFFARNIWDSDTQKRGYNLAMRGGRGPNFMFFAWA
jgi:hypothetical protein